MAQAPATEAIIWRLERLPSSRNGNPRFRIAFQEPFAGGIWYATTASDHAFVYEIGNEGLREGDMVIVTTHDTRGGKVVIDDLSAV
jgi:hypothetical protein